MPGDYVEEHEGRAAVRITKPIQLTTAACSGSTSTTANDKGGYGILPVSLHMGRRGL
jgi:hypothetical protein